MVRKTLIVTFLFMAFSYVSTAQYTAGFEIGKHQFKMDNLKSLNTTIGDYLPFENKIIDNYPSYYNYGFFMQQGIGIFEIGVRYTFNSTGSKISRSDYSGLYSFDSKIKCYNPSAFVSFLLLEPINNLRFSVIPEIGLSLTRLMIEDNLELYEADFTSNESEDFKATSFYFDPSIELKYGIKFINIGIRSGVQIDFAKGELKTSDDLPLKDKDDNAITPDWSGFHANVFLSFSIGSMAK
jgi:hypothetical protein